MARSGSQDRDRKIGISRSRWGWDLAQSVAHLCTGQEVVYSTGHRNDSSSILTADGDLQNLDMYNLVWMCRKFGVADPPGRTQPSILHWSVKEYQLWLG